MRPANATLAVIALVDPKPFGMLTRRSTPRRWKKWRRDTTMRYPGAEWKCYREVTRKTIDPETVLQACPLKPWRVDGWFPQPNRSRQNLRMDLAWDRTDRSGHVLVSYYQSFGGVVNAGSARSTRKVQNIYRPGSTDCDRVISSQFGGSACAV